MIGAEALADRAAPGVCPFCGDPLAVRRLPTHKHPTTCGDEVCLRARMRYYQRDCRAKKRAQLWACVVSTFTGKAQGSGANRPTVNSSDQIHDS